MSSKPTRVATQYAQVHAPSFVAQVPLRRLQVESIDVVDNPAARLVVQSTDAEGPSLPQALLSCASSPQGPMHPHRMSRIRVCSESPADSGRTRCHDSFSESGHSRSPMSDRCAQHHRRASIAGACAQCWRVDLCRQRIETREAERGGACRIRRGPLSQHAFQCNKQHAAFGHRTPCGTQYA